jgi:hypothetical protein
VTRGRGSSFFQRGDDGQGVVDGPGGIGYGEVHRPDGALVVHDEGGAFEALVAAGAEGGQAQCRRELKTGIRQQRERNVLVAAEAGELIGPLSADPVDRGPPAGE